MEGAPTTAGRIFDAMLNVNPGEPRQRVGLTGGNRMTTSHTAPSPSAETVPALSGIHHIGLTVRDVEASTDWYQRVLGLRRWFQESHHHSDQGGFTVVLTTSDMSFSVGLDHHPGNPGEAFDCTRTGLDHVCFHVAAEEDLHAWAAHLDAVDVHHSGVYAMEGFPISLVTFLDPDGIQLELLAIHS